MEKAPQGLLEVGPLLSCIGIDGCFSKFVAEKSVGSPYKCSMFRVFHNPSLINRIVRHPHKMQLILHSVDLVDSNSFCSWQSLGQARPPKVQIWALLSHYSFCFNQTKETATSSNGKPPFSNSIAQARVWNQVLLACWNSTHCSCPTRLLLERVSESQAPSPCGEHSRCNLCWV